MLLHNSTGIFLDNFEDFFKNFRYSKVLVPVEIPLTI